MALGRVVDAQIWSSQYKTAGRKVEAYIGQGVC